jgi:hypothetical protein
MRKIVLTFGLIAGVILSGLMALSMAFKEEIGFDKGLIVGYTTMVLAFLMIFFGVRTYRESVGGGAVTFGRAFKVGGSIMLIASLCYVLSWEVVRPLWAPDYLEKYAAYQTEQMRTAGAPESEIAASEAEMAKWGEWYKNPALRMGMTLMEPLPVGLLFTLLTAWGLSRKRKEEGTVTGV